MKLLIFSADEKGFSYHHTVDMEFETPQAALSAALMVLRQMHDTFGTPVELMQMQNETVIVKEKEEVGIMLVSSGCEWACFVPDIELEGNSPIIHSPTSGFSKQVPEC